MSREKIKTYKPTGKLKDYKEAIQIIFVDYADIWMSGKAKKYYKEIDKKFQKNKSDDLIRMKRRLIIRDMNLLK